MDGRTILNPSVRPSVRPPSYQPPPPEIIPLLSLTSILLPLDLFFTIFFRLQARRLLALKALSCSNLLHKPTLISYFFSFRVVCRGLSVFASNSIQCSKTGIEMAPERRLTRRMNVRERRRRREKEKASEREKVSVNVGPTRPP